MNNWVLILLIFVAKFNTCDLKWDYYFIDKVNENNSKHNTKIEKSYDLNSYTIFNGVAFSIHFIDSISNDIITAIDTSVNNHKYFKNENISNKLNPQDFKIYKIDSIEIAHYKLDTIVFNSKIVIVHEFAYTIGDWNEDLAYYFLYTKEFGVFKKWKPGWWNPDEVYWLMSNSCKPDSNVAIGQFVENYKKLCGFNK